MIYLTPHFTLEELTASDTAARLGLPNKPDPLAWENLKRLADFLEQVKALLGGKPIMVNSAYRSPTVNAAVGSKPSSQHTLGCAADIRVPGMTPDQVVRSVRASALPFDQLIREYDRWTHISVPNTVADAPRRQALIIDSTGTRAFA